MIHEAAAKLKKFNKAKINGRHLKPINNKEDTSTDLTQREDSSK
jgi:hypothetical protein